jgi:O-antigen/teichoic acid export membrane protein
MTLRYRAARGLKWQVLEVVGRQLLSLAVFTTLTRLLQPTDFGLIGLVTAYLAFINMFVDQGIGTALVQRHDLRPEHLDAAFWFNLGCAIAMCGVTVAMAESLASVAGEPRIAPLLRWASVGMIINAAGAVQASLFIKGIDFKHLTFRTLLGNSIGGGIAIAMALSGLGVWALIWQQLIAALVAVAYLWKVSEWRPLARFSLTHLRQLMTVSTSVFATSLLWTFSSRIDQFVIGRFGGAAVLGQYVVGIRLSDMARAALQEPIAAVSMPTLSSVQQDYARLRNALYKAMELHAAVCFAVFGGLAAVAPSVVPLVFGQQWTAGGGILQVVAFYSLGVALSALYHPALLASGGPGRYVFVSIACAVGAAASCFVGIHFSVRAVVGLLTLNIFLMGGIALVFLRQRIGLSLWYFCRPCLAPGAAAALMFLAVIGTRATTDTLLPLWLRTAAEVAAGAATYLLVMWTLATETLWRLHDMVLTSILPAHERAIIAPASAHADAR